MPEAPYAELDYKKNLKLDLFPTIWCPGCGIGTIMMQLAMVLDEMAMDESNTIVVTGIGCTGRMGGYMKYESVYTLHGRTLPVAEAIKTVRPEMHVIVVAGDGDTASIGGNHLIHAIRRNAHADRALQQQRDLRPDRRPDRPDHADRHQDPLVAGRQPEHADQPAGPGPIVAARAVRQDDRLPPAAHAQRHPRGDRAPRLRLRGHHQPVHREQRAAHRLRQRERHAHLLPQDLQAGRQGRRAPEPVRDRRALPADRWRRRDQRQRRRHDGGPRATGRAARAACRTDEGHGRAGGGHRGRPPATTRRRASAPSRRSARR